MKTFQKVLCVMLSILMVMSCFSAVVLAADGEKFTSTLKAHSAMSNAQSAKVTLDMVDEALKEADINEEIKVIGNIKFKLDLSSINALCNTLDSYDGLVTAVLLLDPFGLVLGDLKSLKLTTWKNGLERTGDDIRILTEFIELIEANRTLIKKVCEGSIDLGVFEDYVDVSTLLGADGVSGILKEALIGFVYDEDTAEFSNAYNKYKADMDAFIYDELVPSLTDEYLPGLDLNANSKIEDLLMDVYNISFEKYIKNALTGLDFDFAVAEYEELKKLNGIVNLKGSSFNLNGLTYVKGGAPLQDQVNTILGNYMKNVVPGYSWNFDGGYSALKANIEGSIRYVAEKSGIIENPKSKTIEQIGVEIALIILKNGDFGTFEADLESCNTLEEMASRLLINATKEMKLGIEYTGNEGYLVVLGDILASWAYDNFPVTDNNGKAYRPGGGKDVFEVINYIMNYFLFDRAGASVLGLSTSKTEDYFTKIDKLADYFGQNKSVNFNSKNFFLGTTGKKGLFDCIFTLDIVGLLDLTAIPALNKAGDVSVVEFLYRTVQYFCNNWAGNNSFFPSYTANKAFTNALSNSSIANMISVLLEILENRKSAVITLLTYVAALSVEGEKTTDYVIESATVADMVSTGKELFPTATVKAGGKALTQNTDFVVVTDSLEPGTGTATIKGIGLYSGEITRSFNIKLDKVSSVSYTSTDSTATLKWNSVPYADSYNVLKYNATSKKYETVKAGVTGTSYTVSGLSPNSEYKFSVQAVDTLVGATTAKEITAYTCTSAVNASTFKSSPSASSVTLSWAKVTGATHYRIEQSAGSDKWTKLAETDALSYTVSKLSDGTEYTFRITALKKLSDGKYLVSAPTTFEAKTALATPSSIKATYAATSVALSWAKVKNAEKYVVRYYTGGQWKTVATVTGTSATVEKLTSGSEHQFTVQATSSAYTSSAQGKITAYTLPAAVNTSGVKSSPAASSIKLTWPKVTGATHYRLEQSAGSNKWTKLTETDALSYTVSKLSGGTEYTFRITALKKLPSGKFIASSPITTKAKTALATPSLKSAATTSSVTLSWAKVKNAEKYVVEQYKDSKWVSLKTVTGTSYTVSKLSSATEYKFRVTATSSAYTSSAKGSKTVNTLPAAVKSSSVKTSSTPSSIKLSWSKVTGATHYKIEQYVSKKWKAVATVTGTSKTVSGLSGYTDYTFRITALKKLSDGSYVASAPITVKVKTKLGTPSSLKASYTDTSITLSWSKVKNAQKYEVLRYTGGKWKKLKTVTGTSHKITGLKATTSYKLAVRALVTEGKKTVYGDRKQITQYTGLKKPSNVKASSITATSAKISWSKVSKATSYEVYAYIGGEWVKKGNTKSTSLTVKSLPSGTKTKIRVRAAAKLGGKTVYGTYSSTLSVLTVVGKVTGVKASVRKTSSITLTWKKTTGATGYEIYRLIDGKWKKLGTTTKTTFTDSKSLKRGTEYKYKVRAVQKVNSKTTRYGAYSAQLKAKTTIIGTAKR